MRSSSLLLAASAVAARVITQQRQGPRCCEANSHISSVAPHPPTPSEQSKAAVPQPQQQPQKPRPNVHQPRANASVWQEPNLNFLFENNDKWVKECLREDPEIFAKLSKGQKPQFLFIGCSDSRVPAQQLLGLKAGELFVHRNVANLVVNGDMNLLAVLIYSIDVLDVKDIIVCGHQGCGGIAAASTNTDHGLLEHWLKNIRDVIHTNEAELNMYTDPEERRQRLVELNVYEQCLNLYRNPIVQRSQAKKGYPRIHGMVYSISDGRIKELKVDFQEQVQRERVAYGVVGNI